MRRTVVSLQQTMSAPSIPISYFEMEYEALPDGVKWAVSEREYSWMSTDQRTRLVDEFIYPEGYED